MENNKQLNTQWIIYILVWFFLWAFWIHRFVAWKIWSWIWMLALQLIGWLTVIILIWIPLLWIAWVWWLVDWILLLMWKFEESNWKIIKMHLDWNENIVKKEKNSAEL